jgi:exonuclease VII large subunit
MGKFLQDRFAGLQAGLNDMVQRLISRLAALHRGETERALGLLRSVPGLAGRVLDLRRERLFNSARHYERSAAFTVRDHRRRILARLETVEDRGGEQLRRGFLDVRAGLRRMDFAKRRREADRGLDEVRQVARRMLALIARALDTAGRAVGAAQDLVRANHPDRVLGRGFTLVLDEKGRVVPDRGLFRKLGKARLKFKDGVIPIRKEEKK